MPTLNFIVLVSNVKERAEAKAEMVDIPGIHFIYLLPLDPLPPKIHGIYQYGHSYRFHNIKQLAERITLYSKNWG